MEPKTENAKKAYELAASLWGLPIRSLLAARARRDAIAARRAAWLAYSNAFEQNHTATERDFSLTKNSMWRAAKFEKECGDDRFHDRRFAIEQTLLGIGTGDTDQPESADGFTVAARLGRALAETPDGDLRADVTTLLAKLAEHLEQQNELRDNRDPDGGICGGAGRVGCSSATIAGRAGSNEAPVDASDHERRCSDRGSPSEVEGRSRGLKEPIRTPQNADHERHQDRLCEAEGNADNQRPGADGEADQKALSGSSRHTDQDRREASENAFSSSGCQPSQESRRDDDGRDGRHCHQANGRGDRQAGRCVDEGQQRGAGCGERGGLKTDTWDRKAVRKALGERGHTIKSFAAECGLKVDAFTSALSRSNYALGTARAKAAEALRKVAPEAAPELTFGIDMRGRAQPMDATAMAEAGRARVREAAMIADRLAPASTASLTASFAGDPAPGRSALGRELRPGE